MQKRATVLFTGQGSQWIGMSKSLRHTSHAREMIQLLEKRKQTHLMDFLFTEQQEKSNELTLTVNAQPCIYIHNSILWSAMQEHSSNWKLDSVLGHSLGEYNALHASKAVSIEDGLELVTHRGLLMHQLCSNSLQQMQ